jgi:anti-sigma factor RsiW
MSETKTKGRCSDRGLMLYVDGELDPSQAVDVEEHLSACAPCRAQLDLARAMRTSLRRSTRRCAPSELVGRIEAQLSGQLENRPSVGHVSEARDAMLAGATSLGGGHLRDQPSRGRPSWGAFAAVVGSMAAGIALLAVTVTRREAAAPSNALATSQEPRAPEQTARASTPPGSALAVAGVAAAPAAVAPAAVAGPDTNVQRTSRLEDMARVDPSLRADAVASTPAPKSEPGSSEASHRPSASNAVDEALDQLVALHANPLPAEEKNPENLGRLEPFVGVPVKRSALTLMRSDALLAVREGRAAAYGSNGLRPVAARPSFDGARLHPMRESRGAAALRYVVDGHRVTVYVFDPRVLPLGQTRLQPRRVQARPDVPVYVGHLRGFSVAAAERSGVGYALASDFDEEKTVRMVASF